MRFAAILCLTLSIVGCSQDATTSLPTLPTPPVATPQPTPPPTLPPGPWPPPTHFVLWGYVVSPSGQCIEGATVGVVKGPALVGHTATQKLPCDVPQLTGGFSFDEHVPIDVVGGMTYRVSAPGYVSQVLTLPPDYWNYLTFTLVPTGP